MLHNKIGERPGEGVIPVIFETAYQFFHCFRSIIKGGAQDKRPMTVSGGGDAEKIIINHERGRTIRAQDSVFLSASKRNHTRDAKRRK